MGVYVAEEKPDSMPSYECFLVNECDGCDFSQKFWREENAAKKEETETWYCYSCRHEQKDQVIVDGKPQPQHTMAGFGQKTGE